MKTLKEAYESVGETLQVGDCLGKYTKIRWVDGWFFDDRTYSGDFCTVIDSSRYRIGEFRLPIRRNGKQIYPKVEEVAPLPYSRQWNELVGFYAIKQNMDIMQAQELANLLFDYVCAIIRSKGDKCNS